MSLTRAHITGVGHYVPDYILTNKELETLVDTNDEWIRSRTGLVERRLLKDPGQPTSCMAAKAAQYGLAAAGVGAEELDAIIVATVSPDYIFPATAALAQKKIGATKAYAFDLAAACSGFLFG